MTTSANSPPAPRHDLVVVTQSGGYQQDDIDAEPGITNEALDIAATQVVNMFLKYRRLTKVSLRWFPVTFIFTC